MSFDNTTFEGIDCQVRALSRLLSQFQNSPVLLQIVRALMSEVQVLVDAIIGTLQGRTPGSAVGAQLDVLGRIVGQPRVLYDFGTIPWFAPDNAEARMDVGLAWVEGVPTANMLTPTDSQYRLLIEGKIFRNFCRFGSVPEIQRMVKLVYNVNVSFAIVGPLRVDVYLPTGIPSFLANQITQFVDNTRADSVSPLPIPATVSVRNIVYI